VVVPLSFTSLRNVAWNDFISQINFLPDDSPQALSTKNARCSEFLKGARNESEYDLEYSGPLTKHEPLQKADRDLETLTTLCSIG